MIEVVAAMTMRGERFMICQRPVSKANGDLWEFPGGKIEPGETPEIALAREIREELGMQISVGDRLADTVRGDIHLTLYAAQIVRGEPKLLEHSALAWVTRAQAEAYALCPADRVLLGLIGESSRKIESDH